jgi:hypothetical protein
MVRKTIAGALAVALAVPALAQSSSTTTTTTTTPQTMPPQAPTQPPAAAPPPAAGSSQQVVVNPPTAPAPAAPATPPSAVQVNPPPATAPAPAPVIVQGEPQRAASTTTVVVEEKRRRSPMSIVATNALYGGAAGAVVGAGVALINEGDSWGRDLMLGTGIGVLAGAAVGGVMAYRQSDDRVAVDGLGTPARDEQLRPRVTTVARLGGRF